MGVRYLNTLMKRLAPKGLKTVQLCDFSGKRIVIDTSIYLHKFLAANSLVESMYFMIAQFKYFSITPIFVFDGIAPAEKQGVLNSRECVRENARQKYNQLSEVLNTEMQLKLQSQELQRDDAIEGGSENANVDSEVEHVVSNIQQQMRSLKRRFIRISNSEVSEIKRLMREFDVTYIESDGESDALCAYLVKADFADACMSDDMDMFIYGCPVVLRHVNIWHGTGVQYTLPVILEEMQVSLHEFRMVCILSGTDYNTICETGDQTKIEDTNENEHVNDNERKHDEHEHVPGVIDEIIQIQSCKPIRLRFYLSTLINIVRDYYRIKTDSCTSCQSRFQPNGFDVNCYNSIIETHKKHVSITSKNIYLTQLMFERAYAIFSSDPSNEMKEQIRTILYSSNSCTAPSPYEIPHKVKRIMAKYNFIYI
jgi:5'-3' exonuclease